MVAALRSGFVLALTLLAVQSTAAQVPAPPVPGALAWDGLDRLLALANESQISLERVHVLSLSQVTARDSLLIVGPHKHLPVAALSAFLREGGRIALLDDFGSGGRFLAAYQVERSEAPRGGPALRRDPRLLLAYPRSEHPLAEGVPVLLTNEASALQHPDLKPVFVFGHSSHALALAGAVGAGRLVAIGDSSLLINQLMTLPAHQRFAKNLLEYLGRTPGRIWLVGPDAELVGSFGDQEKQGTAWLNGVLKRASHPDLPSSVLALIALSITAVASVIAISTLPRKSPYLRAALFPDDTVYAGFAGRVALSRQPGSNLMWPLLDLKHELEAELSQLLGLPAGPFDSEAALAKADERALDAAQQSALSALLRRLAELASLADDERGKGAVTAAELSKLEREAGRLTTLLREGSARGHQPT